MYVFLWHKLLNQICVTFGKIWSFVESWNLSGFVEKEIKRANIPTVDTGENPEVPFPRDMIDLEVITHDSVQFRSLLSYKFQGITKVHCLACAHL